jgi:parvulin-like peptidyl-prolyl isomerase
MSASRLSLCFSITAGALLLAAALTACGGPSHGTQVPSASPSSERVVATVNGQPLRQAAIDAVRAEDRLVGQSDGLAVALNEAIDRELIREEASRLGVTVDAARVRARRATIVKDLGGVAGLKAALTHARMSSEQLLESVRAGVVRDALQQAKFRTMTVTERAERSYYTKHRKDLFTKPATVRLSIVVVRTQMIAENAIARLRAGRPFAEVARQFSRDAESSANGGDIGWVLTTSLPQALRKAAANASPGAVSKPVLAAGGWYVLRVTARRAARLMSFAEVRARLRAQLSAAKRSQALDAWLTRARKEATITRP